MQFLTGRGYFLFVAEKPSPTGEGGPKGRMRGECASIARERAAAETLPSSVTCGDSSLREGAFGRERNIVLFAKGHLFEGAAASAAGGVFAFGMMHNKTALEIVDQHNKI